MKLTKFIWKKCHFSIFVLVAVYDIFNTMEIKYRDCPMSKICYFHIDDHKSVVLRQTCVVCPFTIYFERFLVNYKTIVAIFEIKHL